jgi:putative ABC transport system permease protein
MIECGILAALGGALGLLLSFWGIQQVVVAFSPITAGMELPRPYWINVTRDAPTYLFVMVLSIVVSFAFGLLPAWHLAAASVPDSLKSGARGGPTTGARRWTAALLVGELALTLILLTGTGLLWRSFIDSYQRDMVIDPADVVTMRLALPAQKYPSPDHRRRFLEQLDERLSSIAAFRSVSMGTHIPIDFGGPARQLSIDGVTPAPEEKPPVVTMVTIGSRYFETLSLPIVRGRALLRDDGAPGREGVVVDQALAERFFSGGDPIGRRIRLAPSSAGGPGPAAAAGAAGADPGPWFTIVGVSAAVPQAGPAFLVRPMAFVPLEADPAPGGQIVVLVKGDRTAATTALREQVRQLDSSLPLFAIETLDEAVARQRFPVRMIGTWFSVLALAALVMASVGLFSLTAHAVAQRRHEIGVRMAVGAQGAQVVWLFMERAVVQLAIGLALGLAGALGAGGLLSAFLGGVSPRDPITLGVVAAVLVAVALLSSLLPARRATRVDPATTLRSE